ncbi:MAG: hypothetical protein ACLUHE_04560 [Christensenellales bacterium]
MPETLAAGVCALFRREENHRHDKHAQRNQQRQRGLRWGLTRLMALRFLRGGLVFFIRLERMNELPFKFRQNGLFQYIINRAQTEEQENFLALRTRECLIVSPAACID